MSAVKRGLRSSFGSALIGGLVVGILGWIAIAAGWIDSNDNSTSSSTLSAAPLPEPAVQQSAGKGDTVNQIYKTDSPGVAFIQAQIAPKTSAFNPFGSSGGGTATGS